MRVAVVVETGPFAGTAVGACCPVGTLVISPRASLSPLEPETALDFPPHRAWPAVTGPLG